MRPNNALMPRDFTALSDPTGNVYQTAVIIAKRAKQNATRTTEELRNKLAQFSAHTDDLEEISENKEHIEVSKSYEKQPKPTNVATEEFLTEKLMFRYPDEEK
ncbi:MAG: DNA-directed RNA polymerase subunit omega [Roseivirga sp.]